jgi:RNA polymerase sigma-70 factor (ECF subfamily)
MPTPGPETIPSLLFRASMIPRDQAAWGKLVHRYGPCIWYWCRERGMQRADAEDVMQSVLSTLAAKLPGFQYDPARSFRGFLRKLTEDALCDAWRKKKRHVAVGGSENLEVLSNQEASGDLVSRIERAFDLELLESASEGVRRRVELKTWEAYRLTACEERPAREVADLLGMRIGSVYQAKSSVRQMLTEEVRRLEEICDSGATGSP